MKKSRQYSFFDLETQLEKIYEINSFLPKLNTLVDWEMFREPHNKVLVLKSMDHLSDDQTELQIRDRTRRSSLTRQ